MLQKNKTAVIVVTYNRADVTNLLFDSLVRARVESDFELIVVDNNSKLHEFERIKRFFDFLVARGEIKGRLIRSNKNLGFPGGNNLGLKLAFEDPSFTHICLLNNDTIVTDGWLDLLIEASGTNALVGPVTNSVGNEQIVPVAYKVHGPNRYTTDGVREFAEKWLVNHCKATFSTEMLGFFCVLGTAEVFRRVGYLDEIFGIGTYEDDDYCIRCRKAGVELLIARHVFVHHWGSATFNEIASASREKLYEHNQKLFEEKHQVKWVRPCDTIPLALKQEIECCEPEYFKEIQTEYIAMIRGQIRSLDSAAVVLFQGTFNILLCRWINSRLSARKGSWPKLVRLPLQFATLCVFGDKHYRWGAKKAAVEVVSRWTGYARNFALHVKSRAKMILSAQSFPKNRKVLILPISTFEGRVQRPQHLAREMAEMGCDVYWINPRATRFEVGFHLASCIRRSLRVGAGRLTTLSIGGIDYSNFYVSGISDSESDSFISALEQVVDLSECRVIVQSTFWAPLLAKLKARMGAQARVIYDCMDDHIAFGSATKEVEMLEDELLEKADGVVASSDHLRETIRQRTPASRTVSLVRNAAQVDHFINGSRANNAVVDNSDLIVGYFGAIAEWFDDELMIGVARSLPHIRFEMIGSTAFSKLGGVELPENLILLGEQPYEKLPQLVQHWRVGLIPFRLTPLIVATNPVKLYEYSALGLPVVSTPIPEVVNSGLKVFIGSTVDEFKQAIEIALGSGSDNEREARREFARQNTWKNRAEQLLDVVCASEPELSFAAGTGSRKTFGSEAQLF